MQRSRTLLQGAKSIVAVTGAGISAESGVPTFRGAGGLWRNYRPETLATPDAFARDPRLVWEWYAWRREKIAECRPNAAHLALAEAAHRGRATVITQNVDELHVDAARIVAGGAATADVIELHGSIFRMQCTRCGALRAGRAAVDATSIATLPKCERCGRLMRPGVVWFGEALSPAVLERACSLAARADVCLVIGTSAVVQPAASIALLTRENGGAVIEINPEETPLTAHADVSFRATATETVPRLLANPG